MSIETQLIQQLSDEFDSFQQGVLNVSDLTTNQKRILKNAIFTNPMLHYEDPIAIVGDRVYGIGDANINGGGKFEGDVASLPITSESNLTNAIYF